jgi:hypothetical protein
MNDEIIRKLLNFPGAKRAARGVILPFPDGSEFHVRTVIDRRELEGLTPEEEPLYEYCSKKEILRLRELRGPHDYLLRLRVKALAESPRAVRVMLMRREAYERSGRLWSLSHYYHTHDYYHKSYIEYLPRAKAKLVRAIPAGLALVQGANAICVRSLVGDVVVAAEALVHFFYFMSIAYYGGAMRIAERDRADALLIALRIMNGAEALDFDIDPRGKLPIHIERVLERIVVDQMRFTFGHEYAHALLGHTSSAQGSGADNADILAYSHEAEFDADLHALLNIGHKQEAFALTAEGALAALLYLHFLEDVASAIGKKVSSVSSTHPPARERLFQLYGRLREKLSAEADSPTQMLEFAEDLKEMLNKRMLGQRPDILQFYGSVYLTSYTDKRKRDRYDY